MALMEAMSSGINVICSKIRGNTDLISDGLFDPDDVDEVESLILYERGNTYHDNKYKNLDFSQKSIQRMLKNLYKNV